METVTDILNGIAAWVTGNTLNTLLTIFALLGGVLSVKQLIDWWTENQEKRIDTFASIEKKALKLMDQIHADGFDPDLVIGVGRSGAFLAGWLAGNLGSKRIAVVDRHFDGGEGAGVVYPDAASILSSLNGEMLALLKRPPRALIVEGASTSGGTLAAFGEIRKQVIPDWECKYAVLYEVAASRFPCKYVAQKLRKAPKRYPWHKMPHWQRHLGRSA